MRKYSYVLAPTLCVPESTYALNNGLFIYPIFTKDCEFQYGPGRSTVFAIALCKEQIDDSGPLGVDQIENFVLFHSFMSQDSRLYEWFVKEFCPKLVHSKESKSREEFIKSIKRDPIALFPGGIFLSEEERDFEHFPPFIFDREYRISYAETFNKFLQTKDEGRKTYDYIKLYDFAANLAQVNRLYDNIALSLSLLYTMLDDFLGRPQWCGKKLECSCCGRKDVTHDVESLAAYQNRRMGDLLESKERSIIENYQKLLKKMNEIRSATYHGAVFYSLFDEWLKEAKSISGKKEVTEKWPLERITREFKASYLAKSQAEWLFSDFVRSLLINELVRDGYYPKLIMDLIS